MSAYTDTANDTLNMTLLNTTGMNGTINSTISISSVIAYRYYISKIVSANAGYACTCNSIRFQKKAGGYNNLLLNTNYNITTDSTTGLPKITYLDTTTANFMYVYERIGAYELQRRIYPVIRDTNNIYLTDGSNTLSLTSTTIGGKKHKFFFNICINI